MKHKIAVKKPGEPLQILDFEGEYRSDVAPLIFDGRNEPLAYVQLRSKENLILSLICDESGLLKDLPYNFSILCGNREHRRLDDIMGTVVFAVYEWEDAWDHEIWDYKLADISEGDISFIEALISESHQQEIKTVAQLDPYMLTGREIHFKKIDDLEEHLSNPAPGLEMAASLVIPQILLHTGPGPYLLIFTTDPAGKNEYITGWQNNHRTNTWDIYCHGRTEARSFCVKLNLPHGPVSQEKRMEGITKYLEALHSLGFPPTLYLRKNQ